MNHVMVNYNNDGVMPNLLRRQYFLKEIGIQYWAVKDYIQSSAVSSHNSGDIMVLDDNWEKIFFLSLQQNDRNPNLGQLIFDAKKPEDYFDVDNVQSDVDIPNDDNETFEPNEQVLKSNGLIIKSVVDKKIIQQLLPELLVGVEIVLPAFKLASIRYRDWIILVDIKKMDTAQLNVWQSLSERLNKKAEVDNSIFLYQKLTYPFSKEWSSVEGEEQLALSGFFWRLCYYENTMPNKLAILTDMETIGFDERFMVKRQATPTLLEMVQNANNKKAFWAMLHN